MDDAKTKLERWHIAKLNRHSEEERIYYTIYSHAGRIGIILDGVKTGEHI
ncbi:MAG: hypothetical protein GY786_21710 [Proteobacteria bacterium]|nr:hypothetical protein [Pseudomonadota bacterium]